jgi:hypothetical protein
MGFGRLEVPRSSQTFPPSSRGLRDRLAGGFYARTLYGTISGMTPYKKLFLNLFEHNIRYLVAGGFAVNLHQVQRATVDIDLILDLKKYIALPLEILRPVK